MMEVVGIYKIVFEVQDSFDSVCLTDIGLMQETPSKFTALNGSHLELSPGLRGLTEIHWVTVDSNERVEFVDSGIKHVFDPRYELNEVEAQSVPTNSFGTKNRVNRQIPIVDDSLICGIGHVAIYTENLSATIKKFADIGFLISDIIKDKSVFLRSKKENPHHQILVMESNEKTGFQHIAFNVKDMYNVVTKGLVLSSKGFKTVLGPGRHVISSSTTWYFQTPLGLFEVTSDEDYLTDEWKPTEYDPNSSLIYEWAIENGLNHETRRQHETNEVTTFIEQKLK